MSLLKKRFLATLAVTVIAALCGTLAGYRLAGYITVNVTQGWLEQYANRIVADGEASSAELRTVLSAVGASEHKSCSAAEVAYLRTLIFESDYLKDVGRMRDGKIECTAALGRVMQPGVLPRPDFRQQDGTTIYRDLAPYRNNGLTTITLQQGDSFVVFTPLTRMHPEPSPMHFVEMATDAPTQRSGQLLGELPLSGGLALTREGVTRQGDNLYVTRCSIRFFNCVAAYASIPEVVQANRTRFNGCVILCGAFGAFCGLVLSLLYRRNKSLEQQLRRAIRKNGLTVAYQPVVELASGRVVGAEALARWTDEEGRVVAPEVFVRIAEENGFVGEITRLVLRRVLQDFAATIRNSPGFRISINVAAADLSDPEFPLLLDRMLKRSSVSARSLAIEITEGSTVRQDVAMNAIRCLRARGHSVHIDDFGTGYSSLAYLHDLEADAIKIDKAFTRAIGTGSVVVSIIPQILAMAEALNLEVIVEGIETQEQASYFASTDRSIRAQGWLFGRPIPAQEFHRLLCNHQVRRRQETETVRESPSRTALLQPD